MDKRKSVELKGIAIIMMLLYHLFYVGTAGRHHAVNLSPYIGDISVLQRLSEISYPVSLFILITGYGLAVSFFKSGLHKKLNFRNEATKLSKKSVFLYQRLWCVYLLVIPLALFVCPDKNAFAEIGGGKTLIYNLLNISSTYNASEWFLMPYLFLVAFSSLILKAVFRLKWYMSASVALFITAFYLFIYQKNGLDIINVNLGIIGVKIFLTIGFILPFVLGVLAFKHNLPQKVNGLYNSLRSNLLIIAAPLLCVIILVGIRFVVPNQSLQPFAAFLFFIIYPSLRLGKIIESALYFCGRHSVVIWFSHLWFSENLFSNHIYGLYNPLLIFTVVMSLSIVTSLLVERLCSGGVRFVRNLALLNK